MEAAVLLDKKFIDYYATLSGSSARAKEKQRKRKKNAFSI